jgi:hypothetical protein
MGHHALDWTTSPEPLVFRDGGGFHGIAKKDGTGSGAVTLADVRRMLAFPSATNVLGVLAKPGLDP